MAHGYIYVIKNEVGGLGGFKIGKTTDPDRRFSQLKLGTKSSLVGLWGSDHYSELERMLHRECSALRVPQSEWFALKPNDLLQVIKKLNKRSECISLKKEYKPAEPVVIPEERKVNAVVSLDNFSTRTVTPTSPYSGPNPVWTEYDPTKHSHLIPKPKAKVTSIVEEIPTAKTELGILGFLFACALGLIPGIGQTAFIASFCSKERNSALTWGTAVGTIFMILAFAASAEAKPLHTYEKQPHINVSSLIK